MEQWAEIRRRVLVEEVSKRQVLRETGLHWQTLKKVLHHSEPPGYRQAAPREKKKLGPYLGRIEQILKEDKALPKKQEIAFHPPSRILQPGRGSVKGELLLPDSQRGVQRNPAIMLSLIHI